MKTLRMTSKLSVFFVLISILLVSLSPTSQAVLNVKAKCISATIVSSYPLLRPPQDLDITYLIKFANACSEDISSVEVALATRSGSDWRPITTGGKLGKVSGNQQGEVSIRLSYFSLTEVTDTVFLFVREEYPLSSSTNIGAKNVSFAGGAGSMSTPLPSPALTSSSPQPVTSAPSSIESPAQNQTPSESAKPVTLKPKKLKVGASCKKEGLISSRGNVRLICQQGNNGKLSWFKFIDSEVQPDDELTPSSVASKTTVDESETTKRSDVKGLVTSIVSGFLLVGFFVLVIALTRRFGKSRD